MGGTRSCPALGVVKTKETTMNNEERLNRLERQNRRLKYWTVVMVLAGLALLIMGQALPPKVHDLIRAKKIEVVSESGTRVILLESWARGGWISTFNEKGKILFDASATDKGSGTIHIFNSQGKEIVGLSATASGNGIISTFSSEGKTIVKISATRESSGVISTYDAGGTPLIGITARTNGEGAIVQYNRAGIPSRVWP